MGDSESDSSFGAPSRSRRGRRGESDEEDYELEYHQSKRLGLPVNKTKLSSGSWTEEENLTYLRFVVNHLKSFESETIRRKSRIFYVMSKLIKRRTPDQCRSHHQKLQIKYSNSLQELVCQLAAKLNVALDDLKESKPRKDPAKDLSAAYVSSTAYVPSTAYVSAPALTRVADWAEIWMTPDGLLLKIDFAKADRVDQ